MIQVNDLTCRISFCIWVLSEAIFITQSRAAVHSIMILGSTRGTCFGSTRGAELADGHCCCVYGWVCGWIGKFCCGRSRWNWPEGFGGGWVLSFWLSLARVARIDARSGLGAGLFDAILEGDVDRGWPDWLNRSWSWMKKIFFWFRCETSNRVLSRLGQRVQDISQTSLSVHQILKDIKIRKVWSWVGRRNSWVYPKQFLRTVHRGTNDWSSKPPKNLLTIQVPKCKPPTPQPHP